MKFLFSFILLCFFGFFVYGDRGFSQGKVVKDTFKGDGISLTEDARSLSKKEVLGINQQAYFAKLSFLFNKGRLPFSRETRGWWVGRCYSVKNPNTPYGGLLVFRNFIPEMKRSENHGPLSPEIQIRQAFVVFSDSNLKPSYYDHESSYDRGRLLSLLEIGGGINNHIAQQRGSSLVSFPYWNSAYALRKYKNYFVVQKIVTQSFHKSDVVGGLVEMCYFFVETN